MTFYTRVYTEEQERLIQSEFTRLGDKCYLEHAGSTLYSDRQIRDSLSELTLNIYGNPHAKNTSSKLTDDAVDYVRYLILQHFNTNSDEYSVIFTTGATAALKLIAETFNLQNGTFAYLQDNHTSVLGMRQYAKKSECLSPEEAHQVFSAEQLNVTKGLTNSLFAYPAQSNFSGTKYPLSWIRKCQDGALNGYCQSTSKWFCMLDAAAFVSTSDLDLTRYQPDFVCISFYKIFGYPTGLGALLVKRSSAYVLKKIYFGGGSVLMALSTERVHIPRAVFHEHFEDGSLSFLSIMALKHGFETFKRFYLTMADISRHTFNLARYVYVRLKTLRHQNGNAVAILYSDNSFEDFQLQGGIVNFNLLRSSGEYIGYAEVLHIANLFDVHLRTGCFCNPGACQLYLKLTTEEVQHHFRSGHVCGDDNDLIDGQPTGSVRISFGYMSTKKDADVFLKMIEDCFVSKTFHSPVLKIHVKNEVKSRGALKMILLYPIKSCGAFQVNDSWEIINTGFKYDRQWMIVNAAGVCLTQKNYSRMCLILPSVNLEEHSLQLSFEDFPNILVPLEGELNEMPQFKCQSKVCGDQIQGWDCGNEVATWLSTVLNCPGLRLIKHRNDSRSSKSKIAEEKVKLSLTNQAQFLLINMASVRWLFDQMASRNCTVDNLVRRFRPNLVVDFEEPLIENRCKTIKIGEASFKFVGECTRCQMVCVDQSSGEKSPETLKTLSKLFNGKMRFGIYLSNLNELKKHITEITDTVLIYT
ncbi:hypothetical protein FQA39_LY09634 [Lamprigera yunnana]|nr:hypothetical protein FQA39_LY09634 [Lamprigera yunnana]